MIFYYMLSDTDISDMCQTTFGCHINKDRISDNLRRLNNIITKGKGEHSALIYRHRKENEDWDAFVYLGEIEDVARGKYDKLWFQFCADAYISHETDFKLLHDSHLLLPLRAFSRVEELTAESMPEGMYENGVYIAAGNRNFSALLAKLGFKGDTSCYVLSYLYGDLSKQEEIMKEKAKGFFCKENYRKCG